MRHVVTNIDSPNEPSMLNNILTIASFFKSFVFETYPFTSTKKQFELMYVKKLVITNKKLLDFNDDPKNALQSLYVDGSKSKEGTIAGCFLLDSKGNKIFIACTLEFECTNNITEYEAPFEGLKNDIELLI